MSDLIENLKALGGIRKDSIQNKAVERIRELERENTALLADKARLDYIDSLSPGDGWSIYRTSATKNAELVAGDPRTIRKLAGIRAAIDAARKEAQP